ncbi:phosphomannomutase [Alicyclobacillus contaminans]|uniref:phosphomannomutase/phosphoglucomutase n=1 Tax=Alicyclobacillus contaminans TaxID=392016 RepID=UPI00042725B8|nr:phosphomannomutase/phosphoglucomutase [Alicyclobacillus contaminans]GMA49260.1 phosphomannomutase [Alicyclobacillus contaminans]
MTTISTMESTGLPEHVFREYDIRGVAGTEIDERFAYLLGRALARRLRQLGRTQAVVGHDNRSSSPALHRAVAAGLTSLDLEVKDIGEVTTPVFYYSLEALAIPDGVMVTASHNPPEENGFKIAMDKTTIYGDAVRSLRREMEAERANLPESLDSVPSSGVSVDIKPRYLQMLQDKIQLGPRRLKVVVDCGNGTASNFAPEALVRWGCEVIPLYCDSDPTFPNHHPDPVDPANLTDLIAAVRQHGADLGIAFDGDGDRLGVVDESGQIRWGDQLMILYWREILPKHPGCEALVEVKCSQALIDEIERLGGKPRFHRTGHSHIKATLRATQAPFTGEMSGHLFFNDEYFGYDDALYAAGRLLRILSQTSDSLSALFADVPKYHATPETRVPCPETEKQAIIQAVTTHFEKTHPVVTVDGARVQFPQGWALVRSSNTQPILVLRAEANHPEALADIKQQVEQVLRDCGLQDSIHW